MSSRVSSHLGRSESYCSFFIRTDTGGSQLGGGRGIALTVDGYIIITDFDGRRVSRRNFFHELKLTLNFVFLNIYGCVLEVDF